MATVLQHIFLPLRKGGVFKSVQTLSCLFQTRMRSNSTSLLDIYLSPSSADKKTVQDLCLCFGDFSGAFLSEKKDRFPFERVPTYVGSWAPQNIQYSQFINFWFKPCQKPYEIPLSCENSQGL